MIKKEKPKPDGMIFLGMIFLISIGISLILVWVTGYYKSWKFIFSFLGEGATLAAFLVNTIIWGIFVYAIIMLLLGKIKRKNLEWKNIVGIPVGIVLCIIALGLLSYDFALHSGEIKESWDNLLHDAGVLGVLIALMFLITPFYLLYIYFKKKQLTETDEKEIRIGKFKSNYQDLKQNKLNPKSENRLKKAFKSTFPSVFPAFGVYMFSNMMFGSPIEGKIIIWPFFVSWGLFAYWFYHADSNSRMWFRTLVSLAIMSFLFPVAVFIGGVKMSVQQSDGLAGAASLIGTGIATVFIAVFGILFGLAFSVGAYFLGKSLYNQQNITKPKKKIK